MSRPKRKISTTNVYHVVWRGNNKEQIFFDTQDYQKFMYYLTLKKQECHFKLYAWCLMPNHIHLLLKEGNVPLGNIFRGIGSSFVYWYNRKYQRVGHLIQGRYRSEPVEDISYFLKVLRYIHVNPVKGRICRLPEEYEYSSYRKFINDNKSSEEKLFFQLMTREEFIQFHREKVEDICLDIEEEEKKRPADDEVLDMLKKWNRGMDISKIKDLPRRERTALVADLLEFGTSYRQINQITGIKMSVIRAIGKELKS